MVQNGCRGAMRLVDGGGFVLLVVDIDCCLIHRLLLEAAPRRCGRKQFRNHRDGIVIVIFIVKVDAASAAGIRAASNEGQKPPAAGVVIILLPDFSGGVQTFFFDWVAVEALQEYWGRRQCPLEKLDAWFSAPPLAIAVIGNGLGRLYGGCRRKDRLFSS